VSVLLFSLCVRIYLGWYHDEGAAKYGGGIPGYRTWPVGICDRIRAEGLCASMSCMVFSMNVLFVRQLVFRSLAFRFFCSLQSPCLIKDMCACLCGRQETSLN